ncbi:MAG TPA: sulfur carrier protein ThiS [Natronosporangium sp.]|nr:sulfur carrier protein ThiS [Natronosporangium sp.]
MVVTVNGREREVAAGSAVADLVTELVGSADGRGVAVALNGEVLPRSAWSTTQINAGDRLEVLTATQGG